MHAINKKQLIGVVTVAILIIMSYALYFLANRVSQIAKTDAVYSTLGAIAEFSQSQRRLPKDMVEFVDWHNRVHPKYPWITNELGNNFKLKWGTPTKEISVNDHILTIFNPAFKTNEAVYNQWLVERIAGY
jgi:hypothetical protein